MTRVSTTDLKRAHDVLCEHLTNEAREPAIERVVDWLIAEIETRNIRAVAREHNVSLPQMRRMIAEHEARSA